MARKSQAERVNALEDCVHSLFRVTEAMAENVGKIMGHIENLYRMNEPQKGALHPDLLRQSGLQ